ncbi:MAG TPA: glycosyltransferase [Thermoanaerobaculia bacterium]|nr:glycosyltransferase [Thermoanaerobaculia bacterium]
MEDVIQTLWIGPQLSTLERLALRSFLAHGHEVHLYAYGQVRGVPPGAVVRDAREILPEAAVFLYHDVPSYSGFSNFFRYKLLLERGGWWVDSDVVCLAPFDQPEEHVFASEPLRSGPVPATAVIKAPAGSEVMAWAWEICQGKDPSALEWGETGPQLLAGLLGRLGLAAVPTEVFCPLPYDRWSDVLDPAFAWEPGAATRAIHLWNEMWRRDGRSKDDSYPPGCLYERLKARYLSAVEE